MGTESKSTGRFQLSALDLLDLAFVPTSYVRFLRKVWKFEGRPESRVGVVASYALAAFAEGVRLFGYGLQAYDLFK